MSVIDQIDIYSHCNHLGGKIWNAAIRWTDKYAVFISLKDDQGVVGIGECWCFDSSPETLVAFIKNEVAPHFIGLDISDGDIIAKKMKNRATLTARHGILASALSGFDIALWDLRSQHNCVPLWKAIDSNGPGDAEFYAAGGLYGLDKTESDLAAEIAGMVADGHNTAKIKIGWLDAEQDKARVLAALDALPHKGSLIIDAVYSYTADEALRFFEALPDGRISAFQSPVAASDFKGMKRLTEAGVPVMATEAEYRSEIQRQMIDGRCVRYLQTAPIACGGITHVLDLCKLVADTEVEISLEVSSTAIALMASYHLAAAHSAIAHVEFHYVHQVFFEQMKLTQRPDLPGRYFAPDLLGLGIELPVDALVHEMQIGCATSSMTSTKASHTGMH